MTRRLAYATAIMGVLLVAFWATAPSETPQDDSSGTIKLEAPKALAQSSNFPVDYAGIALYVKYEPTDFSDIHAAATKLATDVKDTDGASYIWMEMPRIMSGCGALRGTPILDLYTDTSGWLVAFLPRSTANDGYAERSSIVHFLSPSCWSSPMSSLDNVSTLGEYGPDNSIGFRVFDTLNWFVSEMPGWNIPDLKYYSLYHFAFPQATAIHIAVKRHGSMSFFIPESLTVEKASVAFWAVGEQPENSLEINGPTHGYHYYQNEGEFPWNPDRLVFDYLNILESGRHEVEVSGNVMLAIIVRE